MKKYILLFILLFVSQKGFSQKGFLPPRMTTAQRNAIASPEEGLMIYNTTTKCLENWNATVWKSRCGSSVPPAPDLGVNCSSNSWFIPVLIKGNNTGNVSGKSVTVNYDIAAYSDQGQNTMSCNLPVYTKMTTIGRNYSGGSNPATLKFNRPISNLKIYQSAIHKGEKFRITLKRNGVIVSPTAIFLNHGSNCNSYFNLYKDGNIVKIDCNNSGTNFNNRGVDTAYLLGGVWFDEVIIDQTENDRTSSCFVFCVGAAL